MPCSVRSHWSLCYQAVGTNRLLQWWNERISQEAEFRSLAPALPYGFNPIANHRYQCKNGPFASISSTRRPYYLRNLACYWKRENFPALIKTIEFMSWMLCRNVLKSWHRDKNKLQGGSFSRSREWIVWFNWCVYLKNSTCQRISTLSCCYNWILL
jgi:hypothetical protein